MSGLPAATVVVPAYNAARTIDECVRSLLALRYPRELLELVVVDNGSRDATRRLVEGYAGRVRLLEQSRRGPASARNEGIRRSAGEIVAFTDADCTVEPDWLRILAVAAAAAGVGIAAGRILARPGANAAERFGETIHDQRAAIEVWRPPYAITMSWASRRSVLEDVGLFDESLRRVEDGDLSYRIGRAGYSLVYCDSAVVHHRNERSLLGLCREGWQHGFYAVPVGARHAAYIDELRATRGPATAPERETTRYSRAFESGKRLGRATGRALHAARSRGR